MHDIFVSHASDDKDRVENLVRALEQCNLRVWWDNALLPGDSFPEEIEKAFTNSRCVIVCWTKAFVQQGRDWTRAEAEKAQRDGVLISVKFDNIELPLPFNVREYVDFSDWHGDTSDIRFGQLLEGVNKIKRAPSSVPPPSARKSALLVGVSEINADVSRLSAVENNIRDLEKLFQRTMCGFAVNTLLEPKKEQLEIGLYEFLSSAASDTLVVLYFCGYILLDPKGVLLLTTTTTKLSAPTPTTLNIGHFERDYLADCKSEQIVLILDGCYGRMVDNECVFDLSREEISNAWKTYLESSRGRILISSGSGASSAPSSWQGKHSLFTEHLLRGLSIDVCKVDANDDKLISVGEIADYLDTTLKESGEAHRPIHEDFGIISSTVEFAGSGDHTPEMTPAQRDFVSMLAPELEQDGVIPFLGDGVYGSGPLSFYCITKALAEKAGLRADIHTNIGIATGAESLEVQRGGDRCSFLRTLSDIISDQAQRSLPASANDLILDLPQPWFVVSVNYDNLLEQKLDAAKRPYVLVSHILRSCDEANFDPYDADSDAQVDYSGRLLVVRSPNHPRVLNGTAPAAEICLSRELNIAKDDCVIYRLLGAPFLNELAFAKQNHLDTVVITETDHIDFLSKLRNPDSGVPRVFASRFFRKRKLLFLEYNLDVWHYRLVGHLFRQTGSGRADGAVNLTKKPYVVRISSSAIEERFWDRLNPERVSIDTTMLLRALRASRTSQ